jgi:glycosyltransferase involved in cell wall biosynthesis
VKTPRRVLIVHDYQGVAGGAEIVVQDLRRALLARGIDARLLASTARATLPEHAADYTFPGTTGPARALPEVTNPGAVAALRRALRTFDPDVVHLGMFLTQASPAILPLLRRRPALWWANEYRGICPTGTRLLPDRRRCPHEPGRVCVREGCVSVRGLLPRAVQRMLLRRWASAIDRTLTPSRATADEFEAQGWSVDAVVPHWVPAPPVRRALHATPVVAFAGRLDVTKGVDVLLRAFTSATAGTPEARLWILGEGPDGPRLRSLARDLGIEARTEFAGASTRDEVQRRLAAAWVQCVPSIWSEPFGLVVIEAQRRGTPVLASAVGALPELIQEGETGFLVAPDDPGALAGALRRVLGGEVDLAAVGDAGRRRADKWHSEEALMPDLLDHYTSIIRSPVA